MLRRCEHCDRLLRPDETAATRDGRLLCPNCDEFLASTQPARAAVAAPVVKAHPPSHRTCSVCGRAATVEELTEDRGQLVCQACLSPGTARVASGDRPPPYPQPQESPLPAPPLPPLAMARPAQPTPPPRAASPAGGGGALAWILGGLAACAVVGLAVYVLTGHGTSGVMTSAGMAASNGSSTPSAAASAPSPAVAEVPWEDKVTDAVLEGNRLQAIGRYEEALAEWERATALFPPNAPADMRDRKLQIAASMERLHKTMERRQQVALAYRAPAAGSAAPPPMPAPPPASAAPKGIFDFGEDGGAPPAPVDSARTDKEKPDKSAAPAKSADPAVAAAEAGQARPADLTVPDAAPSTQPATNPADAMARANAAMEQKHYDEAAAAYLAVAMRSPNDFEAVRGVGLAKLAGHHEHDAIPWLERAVAARPLDRATVMDLAAVYLNENPMRAVRVLRDFLSAPQTPLDETAQNALGTALARGRGQVTGLAFFDAARQFYLDYDQRLNASRSDGQRRWGNTWIDAADADRKWSTLIDNFRKAEVATREWGRASVARKHAWDMWQDEVTTIGLHTPRILADLQRRYKEAVAAETEALQRMNEARSELARTEQPPFPPTIEFVLTP